MAQSKKVYKTPREQILNNAYKKWLSFPGIIPEYIVRSFLEDVEEIKKENYIYNT